MSDVPNRLADRVREVLPELAFANTRFIDTGADNQILVLDESWIVRFPRNEEYRARFAAELNLLKQVRAITPISVPDYEFIAPDGSFGAYRMIKGRRMTPEVFRGMAEEDGRAILMGLGKFLSVLHQLPESAVAQADGHVPRTWSGEQFAALYRGMRRAKIARVVDDATLGRFDAFHESLEKLQPGISRLVHDDISDDHLLVADGKLAGIIDFSDASYGDAAIDFGWFWRLGEDAVDLVFANYSLLAEDKDLKRRSYWTFVRYFINQLSYGGLAKWRLTPEDALAQIDPHLRKLGF